MIKAIIEIVNDQVASIWADQPINFNVDSNGYYIHGEVNMVMWYSQDPESPQYNPEAEGLTKYYPAS